MTRPRNHVVGAAYLVERECIGTSFCRVPFATLKDSFLYCLARASERYAVDIHAYSLQPHRWQGVVMNRGGRLSSFLTWFHQYLAKCICSLPRLDELWSPRRAATKLLEERSQVIAAVSDVLTEPAIASQDENGDWQFLRSSPADFRAEPLGCPRPKVYFRAGSRAAAEAHLSIVLPGGGEASRERSSAVIREKLQKERPAACILAISDRAIGVAGAGSPGPGQSRGDEVWWLVGAERIRLSTHEHVVEHWISTERERSSFRR